MSKMFAAVPKVSTRLRNLVPRCANADCSIKPYLLFGKRRLGVYVAEQWYCCADCFEVAAADEMRRLVVFHPHKTAPAHRNRMPLGLTLLSRGALTTEQLRVAVEAHRNSGERIGDVVKALGFATEEQVTSAVAAQWGCPTYSLRGRYITSEIMLPISLVRQYRMLPVHFVEASNKLLVGFVDGIDYSCLQMVEQVTGCIAVPCFITPSDYCENLQFLADEPSPNEVVFERVSSPLEMARIARNYCCEVGAQSVHFGACRDYLWGRIDGVKEDFDLLFRFQNTPELKENWIAL